MDAARDAEAVITRAENQLRLHHHLGPRRQRAMFATLGFVVGLVITRGVTTLLHDHGAGQNGGIIIRGVHIHHLVFGIVAMLTVGYLWLLLYGFQHEPRPWAFRLSAVAFGVASALILDEFALWLNLRDVYWQTQGRESVDALAVFAGVLVWAVLIGPFARAVWRHYRPRRDPPSIG